MFSSFPGTWLNPAVVPFIEQCGADVKINSRDGILCGSYIEMVTKLDASNVSRLSSVDDFTAAMHTYDNTQINDFCKQFLDVIPTQPEQYPETLRLFNYVKGSCSVYCYDDSNIDSIIVKPICRVFATGFQLLDTKAVAQPGVTGVVNNTAINHEQVKTNQNIVPVQSEVTAKSENTSDNVKSGQETPLQERPIVNDIKIDEVDESVPKENSSPNAEPASETIPKTGTAETESKSIAPIRVDQTPSGEPEEKVIEKSSPSSSVNSTANVKPAEKPVNDPRDPISANEEDDDDKMNVKDGVTDLNGIDEGINFNSNDKLAMSDDSIEDEMNEPNEEDENVSIGQPAKSPSKEQQLQNEDPFTDDTDSNFFTYFMLLLLVCVIAYVVYHNKTKMLALMLEGRRSSTNGRSGLSRRKHTAAYRKLDSNLEEAITSSANGRSTQVIY